MKPSLIWPLLLIFSALVITGFVAYAVVDSPEDDPATRPFAVWDAEGTLTKFGAYNDAMSAGRRGSSSFVVPLNLDLLESSIDKSFFTMPAGKQVQIYNYAVTEGGEIAVAVWTEQDYSTHLSEAQLDADDCVADRDWSVAGRITRKEPSMDANPFVMINVYPEFQDVPVSPCWVTLPTGRKTGLLDGSSKHLMLAQGPKNSLDEFSSDWKDATVLGAGEIIVNIRGDHCAYTITDASGTFRPYNPDNLENVALTFGRSLREDDGDPVPPDYIMDKNEGLLPFEKGSALSGTEDLASLDCPRVQR